MFVLRGTSERVAAAVRAADTGDTGPAEELWAAAVRAGGPLLEPDGDGQVAATFLWRGAADRVDLVGIYNNKDLRATTLTRIDGTDVWHLTLRLPGTLRTGYGFSVGEKRGALATDDEWREATQRRWRTDPLNGETFRMTYNTDGVAPDPAPYTLSVFDPAGRGPSRWLRPDPAVPAGEVTMHRLPAADTGLGCDHRVWLYRPAGEAPAGGWPLALLFDGEYYVELIPTPTILDNLAAAGRIPPTAAVLLDSVAGTRTAELNGNRAFLAFLVDELLPWAGKLLPCTTDPSRTVVAGASLGGACASYAALTAPDRFGLVLAQSGAYQWGGTDDFPEGLIVGYGSAPRLPIRWYLDVGLAEDAVLPGQATSLLEANRRMRDALAGRGYRLRYVEHPGGHDHLRWRDTLADGLIELLGAA
jgi:enterochelin esterase family protein